jgi:hypothetical protein
MKVFTVFIMMVLMAGCGSAVKVNEDVILNQDYNITGTGGKTALNWTYSGVPVTADSYYFESADMRYQLRIQIGEKKYQGEIHYTFKNNWFFNTVFKADFNISSGSNIISGNIINNNSNQNVHIVDLAIDSNKIKGLIFVTNSENYYQINDGVKMNGARKTSGYFTPPAWDLAINNHFIKGLMEIKNFRNEYFLKTDVNSDELLLFILLDFAYIPGFNEYRQIFRNYGNSLF